MKKKPPARLFCLLARETRTGVIFRRGPSRQVLLIRWDLTNDTFEFGQWFKGRIYERRCDLSPSGEKLIYFAASYREPLVTWTAISKPPWLTAIALWPKGDGWNGGGDFLTNTKVVLNHPPHQGKLHPDFDGRGVQIVGYARQGGEDASIYHHLLERSGWNQTQEGVWENYSSREGWLAKQPDVWTKRHPHKEFSLNMRCHGIARRNQGWYDLSFDICDKQDNVILNLEKSDWAEWDSNGDLLLAKAGQLFRAKVGRKKLNSLRLLGEFNSCSFESREAPAFARNW